MNDYALIYHWWDGSNTPVWESFQPLLLSIATLRAFEKAIPIHVLDCSGIPKDYAHYPEKLNFKVVPWTMEIARHNPPADGSKCVTRFFDVWKYAQTLPQKYIGYSDCDIFWFKSPFPLPDQSDRLAFNGRSEEHTSDRLAFNGNGGYMYFNRESPITAEFFNKYFEYALRGLQDDAFREYLYECCAWKPTKRMCIEMPSDALRKEHPEWFFNLRPHEMMLAFRWHTVPDPKCFHVCTLQMNRRGLVVPLIKELHEIVKTVLTEDEIASMIPRYQKVLKCQFSYHDAEFVQLLRSLNWNLKKALESRLKFDLPNL